MIEKIKETALSLDKDLDRDEASDKDRVKNFKEVERRIKEVLRISWKQQVRNLNLEDFRVSIQNTCQVLSFL